MDSYGFLWIPMDSYGFLWIPMDSHGFPMDSDGFLWIPMDYYEFPLIPRDSYGFLFLSFPSVEAVFICLWTQCLKHFAKLRDNYMIALAYVHLAPFAD